tara:strand:+ start:376 stop:546 length:171 start_codon:yes stop_codon:yes gene_type:complete
VQQHASHGDSIYPVSQNAQKIRRDVNVFLNNWQNCSGIPNNMQKAGQLMRDLSVMN